MNGATHVDTRPNSELDVADTLPTWATDLANAAKAYKGSTDQESLTLRNKMTGTAKQIINAIKEPTETCFEHSVQVELNSKRCL